MNEEKALKINTLLDKTKPVFMELTNTERSGIITLAARVKREKEFMDLYRGGVSLEDRIQNTLKSWSKL